MDETRANLDVTELSFYLFIFAEMYFIDNFIALSNSLLVGCDILIDILYMNFKCFTVDYFCI